MDKLNALNTPGKIVISFPGPDLEAAVREIKLLSLFVTATLITDIIIQIYLI